MSYRDLALSLNPLAYLDLREAGGATVAVDSSNTGNNAGVSGATPGAHLGPAGVPVGTAYQFHAGTDALTVLTPVNYPTGNAPWSKDVWVYVTSGAAVGAVASWGNLATEGVELSVVSATVIHAYFGHGASTLSATVSSILNAWHKLTLTWDGLLRTLYLDGAQVAQDAPALPPNLTNTLALIGANSLHSAITGYIAHYLVVPTALVGPQVNALWIQGGTRKVLLTRSIVDGSGSPPLGAVTTNALVLPFGTDAFGTQGSGNGYEIDATVDQVDILADGTSAIEALAPQDMVPDQYLGAYAGGTTYGIGPTVTSGGIWYRRSACSPLLSADRSSSSCSPRTGSRTAPPTLPGAVRLFRAAPSMPQPRQAPLPWPASGASSARMVRPPPVCPSPFAWITTRTSWAFPMTACWPASGIPCSRAWMGAPPLIWYPPVSWMRAATTS